MIGKLSSWIKRLLVRFWVHGLVFLVLVVLALVSLSWSLSRQKDYEGLALNFGTEMVGALVTYFLFVVIIEGRERREAEKRSLIEQMGLPIRDEAIAAVEKLRARGWLSDGSLKKANLWGAELRGASLESANLQKAILVTADLREARLADADLQGAKLIAAQLQDAILHHAKLQRVDLGGANLKDARLLGANLEEANLEGVFNFEEALIAGKLILPDGTEYKPSGDRTHLRRFTDSQHTDFWRSDDPLSPAFSGEER